jgi:hypothetical protein
MQALKTPSIRNMADSGRSWELIFAGTGAGFGPRNAKTLLEWWSIDLMFLWVLWSKRIP